MKQHNAKIHEVIMSGIGPITLHYNSDHFYTAVLSAYAIYEIKYF